MLIVGGEGFRSKFESKHGYSVLKQQLKKWYGQETVWITCFALLYGIDPEALQIVRLSDMARWLTSLGPNNKLEIFCPSIWDVIVAMLGTGLEVCIQFDSPEFSSTERNVEDRDLFRYVVSLISAMYIEAQVFRDFVALNDVVKDVLRALYMGILDHSDAFDDASISDADNSLSGSMIEHARPEDNPSTTPSGKLQQTSLKQSASQVLVAGG